MVGCYEYKALSCLTQMFEGSQAEVWRSVRDDRASTAGGVMMFAGPSAVRFDGERQIRAAWHVCSGRSKLRCSQGPGRAPALRVPLNLSTGVSGTDW